MSGDRVKSGLWDENPFLFENGMNLSRATATLKTKLLLAVKHAHHLLLFNAHRIHWRDCRRRGQA